MVERKLISVIFIGRCSRWLGHDNIIISSNNFVA